jgi:hypothetical protein
MYAEPKAESEADARPLEVAAAAEAARALRAEAGSTPVAEATASEDPSSRKSAGLARDAATTVAASEAAPATAMAAATPGLGGSDGNGLDDGRDGRDDDDDAAGGFFWGVVWLLADSAAARVYGSTAGSSQASATCGDRGRARASLTCRSSKLPCFASVRLKRLSSRFVGRPLAACADNAGNADNGDNADAAGAADDADAVAVRLPLSLPRRPR